MWLAEPGYLTALSRHCLIEDVLKTLKLNKRKINIFFAVIYLLRSGFYKMREVIPDDGGDSSTQCPYGQVPTCSSVLCLFFHPIECTDIEHKVDIQKGY